MASELNYNAPVDTTEIIEWQNKRANKHAMEKEAINELLRLELTNAETLYQKELALMTKKHQKLVAYGYDAATQVKMAEFEAIAATEQARIKEAKGDKAKIAQIKAEYAQRRKLLGVEQKDWEKYNKTKTKIEDKQQQKLAKGRAEAALAALDDLDKEFQKSDTLLAKTASTARKLFGNKEDQLAAIKEANPEVSDKQAKAMLAIAKFNAVSSLAGDFLKQMESTMKSTSELRGLIDTQLQGSKRKKDWSGSYWKEIDNTISGGVGVSPFVAQADVVENLKTLVGKGITYNVEQRAFLETIKEKIATTFNAADGALLKLVRIQQADTTAARLGMESALTSFLNEMYETTEYMQGIASDIRAQIYEASALMGAKEATEFEFQVQKWMGSLHSVGFNSTSGLAGALGKLAAGDISGITEGGFGNLLVMAANRAGDLSIADILANGLDDSSTNKLMQAMVEYLGQIYEETKNSKVVAQQFANVYGISASDLKAAANLAQSTKVIATKGLNYGGMLDQLNSMANSMWQRTSTGEMMDNLFGNVKYKMAANIGGSPVLYAMYQASNMLDQLAGGIALPMISVMGNTVDLHTTVADLMRVGVVGGGILGSIGDLVSGLAKGSGGGFSGSGMLKAFGVSNNISTVSRGTGSTLASTMSGNTVSESGYVGNSEGSDVKNKTMQDAQEDGDNQLAEATDDSEETKLSTVDEHIIQIYELLERVTSGVDSFKVSMAYEGAWTGNFPG